ASRHGMEPLLYWHLNATCPDAVPTARMEALHRAFHTTALYNHFCTEELLTLLHLLDGHGLPTLPYKGPTLAMGAYGDLAAPWHDKSLAVRVPAPLPALRLGTAAVRVSISMVLRRR